MLKTFQAATIGAALIGSTLMAASPASASTTHLTDGLSASALVKNVSGEVAEPADTVVYTVQSGDTLSGIGAKYCTSWQAIYTDNERIIGRNPDVIQVGEKLTFMKGSCSGASSKINKTITTNYVNGTPQKIAWNLLPSANRAEEYSCLNSIVMSESSWNIHAYNPSGAYGIPQALPGSKMAGPWGTDWEGSAYVQLYWMIRYYIPQTYGTACNAWAFHIVHGWY